MGFWSKLGKIGLTAAPYVAAPFTGGASLAFAPMANQAAGMIQTGKKGLGPSKFDRVVGAAGDIAGMTGGFGTASKFGGPKLGAYGGGGVGDQGPVSNIPGARGIGQGIISGGVGYGTSAGGSKGWQDTLKKIGEGVTGKSDADKGGGWASTIAKILGVAGAGYGAYRAGKALSGEEAEPFSAKRAPSTRPGMEKFSKQAQRGLGPVMGDLEMSSPNLAESLASGRMDAISNQPFRRGYNVNTLLDYDEETGEPIISVNRMPRIGVGNRSNRGFGGFGRGGGGNEGQESDRSAPREGNRGGGESTYQAPSARDRRKARGLEY